MDFYLPPSITFSIYSYMSWYDLHQYNIALGITWKRICEIFCQDKHFKETFEKFYLNTSGLKSHKMRFLSYINHVLNYIHHDKITICIPDILWKDIDFCLVALERGAWRVYRNIPDTIKNNRNFILNLIRKEPLALQYIHQKWMNDIEIVIVAIQKNYKVWDILPDRLKKNKKVTIEALKQDKWWSWSRWSLPDTLKTDHQFIFECLKYNYTLTSTMMDRCLLQDRMFMEGAVKYSGLLIKYASDNIKSDRKIVLEAVKQNWKALEYANKIFRKDREIVLVAVKQNGQALEFANEIFRKDREIVLEAVKQHGKALHLAACDLRHDKELVRLALQNNGSGDDIGCDLVNDIEFMLEIINTFGWSMIKYASNKLKQNRTFMFEAMQYDKRVIRYADDKLKLDQDFIVHSIQCEPWVLK